MRNIDELLTDKEKREILEDSRQHKIIDFFKTGMKSKYKPPRHNADPLDQAITVAITSKEKDVITKELKAIKKTGARTTISSFCRKRVISSIDMVDWKNRAFEGLKTLNSPNWNKRSLKSKKNTAIKRLSKVKANDNERKIVLQTQINMIDKKLLLLERPTDKRAYRMKVRFTYNEAKDIRWKASRLYLTVADYIRFILFDYKPNTEDDRTMSVNYRRRFYVGIMDVSKSGWGTPPDDDKQKKINKYLNEIKELKRKNERLQAILTPRQIQEFNK